MDEKVENASDMFSLGCIIVAIHNKGRSLISSNQSIHTYRQQIAKIDSLISSSRIPSYLQGKSFSPLLIPDTVRQLLTRYPHDRMSASAFQHSPLFDNILMNSIKFLDSFPEKTKSEKSSFLRGFVAVLPQFSDRIRQRKVRTTEKPLT
jgi:SCY1-like protein 2